ncbi:hypothetical protein QYM36_006224 [Artemia franciscana]|uniref:Protein polybromo-1 n=1 Tax=Artemia franciscana TaxID=6661 RepID=A0AA88I8U3_ARTSF|nr:hypothetical protein QYM36_006224 [Artemia franciscana]
MGRRRRVGRSSTAAEEEEDSETERSASSTPQPPAKRKRGETKTDSSELLQQLVDHLRSVKREDGSILCESFIRAPNKRQDPTYFESVTSPIDMLKIQQKMRTDEYKDITQLSSDFELLVGNAKSYYKPESQEFKDAEGLWEQFLSERCKLFNIPIETEEKKDKIILRINKGKKPEKQESPAPSQEEVPASPPPFDLDVADEFFSTVMQAVDVDGELIHTPFLLLPSKKLYPDYYDVIQNPVDLKLIAMKIQKNAYPTFNDLEADFLQIVKNACTYNEPGSLIYKRAKSLRKLIVDKKKELERGGTPKVEPLKGEQGRLRARKKQAGPSFLVQIAEMEYEDIVEETVEDKVYGDPDDPLWQLFTELRNYSVNHFKPSELFLRLPSKRWFPDFYTSTENLVSFSSIRKKLLAGVYGTVAELAGDFNIMFESAKQYHQSDTKWYKNAVLLQKHMQEKLHEIYDRNEIYDRKEEELPEKKKRGRKSGALIKSVAQEGETDLKSRLRILFRMVMDYVEDDGRQPVVAFLEKPSKKLYPEYYQVILEPMDMVTIEAKMKENKYQLEEDLIDDFKLMFNNCRLFNEEGSVIYDDADLLERVLMDKARSMGIASKRGGYRKRVVGTGIQARIRSLYDAVREYVDEQDRHLAMAFLRQPSKADYPDYYELIQNPIDLEQIGTKVRGNQYSTLDELLKDMVIMFDNACKYNEPESQLYRDALSLQLIAMQKKIELNTVSDDGLPDVSGTIQAMMMEIFVTMYNKEDESGRYYSDSMCELPEYDEINGKKVRGLSLDLIKRRVDKGLYKRLDTFQEDLFVFFERARRLTRTDSQTFEDSIEMQKFYIHHRNLLCKNGTVLSSPALNYTPEDLIRDLETLKHSKRIYEQQEDDFDALKAEDESTKSDIDSLSIDKEIYKPGDFVYFDHKEKGLEPRIFQIIRLSTSKDGQKMFFGNFFARPIETYHLSSRLFLMNEVFKTEIHQTQPLSEVVGKCYVMPVKDYFRLKPEGFQDKDIFVCESRYNSRQRHFRKIKILCWDLPMDVEIIPREEPLEPIKVRSVFKERVLKHKEEIMELEELATMPEKRYPNIDLLVPDAPMNTTYFQQFQTPAGLLRTGDCVYVRGENGRQLIAQIDSMWLGPDAIAYFHGPWYVTPVEMAMPPKLCYKQEVFLSSIEDSNPILSITGRCAVLDYHEYTTMRPTEFSETDVYVCESMYEEARREIRGLPLGGLKRHNHDPAVKKDEFFYFIKNLIPRKEPPPVPIKIQPPATPISANLVVEAPESLCEDSMDGPPASIGSTGETSMSSMVTPGRKSKKDKDGVLKSKVVTGYIVYASEFRKSLAQKYPESTFGEISRLVGTEWKKLSPTERQLFENKAIKLNEESAAETAILRAQMGVTTPAPETPKPAPSTPPIREDVLFECLWAGCEIVFEDMVDLQDHVCIDPCAHLNQLNKVDDSNLHCQWKGCSRVKKGLPPFPNWARLLRHVREVHCQKNTGRPASLVDKSKPLVKKRIVEVKQQPSQPAPPPPSQTPVLTEEVHTNVERKAPTPAPTLPPSPSRSLPDPAPMFISVPPRPHRISHSDVYKKYIENMQSGSHFLSNWDRPEPPIEKEKVSSCYLFAFQLPTFPYRLNDTILLKSSDCCSKIG